MADATRIIVGELLGASPAKAWNGFLRWVAPAKAGDDGRSKAPPGPNIYRVPVGERTIDVRMSSIHGVKGETHFATLVVETFYHSHAIKSLLPWDPTASPEIGAGRR